MQNNESGLTASTDGRTHPRAPFGSKHATLRDQAVHGVTWLTATHGIQQGVSFVASVVLARLLVPEDFGLLGMAIVVTGFARLLSEFGLGSALVQRKVLTPSEAHSVFWISLAIGVCLYATFFFAAPLIADFYGRSELVTLTRVVALNFVLRPIAVVPRALLQRRLQFRNIGVIELVAEIGGAVVAIQLARTWGGPLSLAAQSLTVTVVGTGLMLVLARWLPRTVFSARAVRYIATYGAELTGFTALNYWARNVDNLLIGKLMSAASLGIYVRAYSLMLLPITQVISVISRVMFPVLASIQDDKARVRRVYQRAIGLIAFVSFPMIVGLIVVAEPLVLVLFGPQWRETASIVRILAVVGITQCLCSPVGWIYTSQGRTDALLRWGLWACGGIIVAIVVGSLFFGSVQAVAWAYLAANLLLTYPCIERAGRLIDLSFADVALPLIGILWRSITMGAVVWAAGLLVNGQVALSAQLIIQIVAGPLAYAILVCVGTVSPLNDVRMLIAERWTARLRPQRVAIE